MQGNYYHIVKGSPTMGVRYMRGGPWDKVEAMYMTADEIFNYISSQLSAGHTVTAESHGVSDSDSDAWGIA